jgi:Ca2+/H+ antiporter
MTGVSYIVGGYNRMEQYFNLNLAMTLSNFLVLAVAASWFLQRHHILANTAKI